MEEREAWFGSFPQEAGTRKKELGKNKLQCGGGGSTREGSKGGSQLFTCWTPALQGPDLVQGTPLS